MFIYIKNINITNKSQTGKQYNFNRLKFMKIIFGCLRCEVFKLGTEKLLCKLHYRTPQLYYQLSVIHHTRLLYALL